MKKLLKTLCLSAVFLIAVTGCNNWAQLGETKDEAQRRHIRNNRIALKELEADVDRFLQTDEPSKLTDMRIP